MDWLSNQVESENQQDTLRGPNHLWTYFIQVKWQVWALAIFIGVVLVYRFHLCTLPNLVSFDAYRHLGFTSQLSQVGFSFYQKLPIEFPIEGWNNGVWREQHYIYPPVSLLFYGFFSSLGLGLAFVKIALTIIELVNAALIGRLVNPWVGALYFASPLSMVYASVEGQYEPVMTTFTLLSVLFGLQRKWIWAGLCIGLAIQTKQFAILLVPWLLIESIRCKSAETRSPKYLCYLCMGIFLSVIPFVPFYWVSPDILLRPLQNQSTNFNPFGWPIGGWILGNDNSSVRDMTQIWTTILCISAGSLLAVQVFKLKSWHPIFAGSTIVLLMKSVSYTQYWYAMVIPAFFVTVRNRVLAAMLIAASIVAFSFRSFSLLQGDRSGNIEHVTMMSRMYQCRYICKFKSAKLTPTSKETSTEELRQFFAHRL